MQCSNYGRGTGVGRGLGVGSDLGVGVGLGVVVGLAAGVVVGVTVAVGVAVAVVVAVAVGVGVGVGPLPPQTIISLSVQTAVCPARAFGTFIVPLSVQSFVFGLYRPPEFK
jgi:hypothetical protein